MKYKTVVDHWEVKYTIKFYDDGKQMVGTAASFESEDEAVAFARSKRDHDPYVKIIAIGVVCGW